MRLYGWRKGLDSCFRIKKKERENILYNALRGAARPWTLEEVKARHPMSKDEFYENISHIFPLILELTSKGFELTEIEEMMLFKDQFIKRIFNRFPKLRVVVREARKTKLDDAHFQ